MASLLDGARQALEGVQSSEPAVAGTAVFRATWSVSLAAGFLEALAILEPDAAEELSAEFAAVATLTKRLEIGTDRAPAPEVVAVRGRRRRKTDYLPRVMVRRVLPDRRIKVRRQLDDRRRAASA